MDKDRDAEKQESEKKRERFICIKSCPPQNAFRKNTGQVAGVGESALLVRETQAFSPSYIFLQKDVLLGTHNAQHGGTTGCRQTRTRLFSSACGGSSLPASGRVPGRFRKITSHCAHCGGHGQTVRCPLMASSEPQSHI